MVQVANWDEPKVREIVRKYDSSSSSSSSSSSGSSGSSGEQVAEEVLRCSKELQEWNPSGSYCVTIPWHHGEQRELRPAELLKLVAGMEVPGCRQQQVDIGAERSSTDLPRPQLQPLALPLLLGAAPVAGAGAAAVVAAAVAAVFASAAVVQLFALTSNFRPHPVAATAAAHGPPGLKPHAASNAAAFVFHP